MNNHLSPSIASERLIKLLRGKGITDERILDTFRKVPRHLFVDGAMYAQAYDDNALPVGFGQTISQPYVVALMTTLLNLKKDEKVLEIGTGSGFQTAIIAQFTRRLYTIERHRGLGDATRKRLGEMGYVNIVFKIGDGTKGWPQHAPFDKIIVTAGAPSIPETLTSQLSMGGRLLIPTGDRNHQELVIYDKTEKDIQRSEAGSVVFVPLIGEHGWEE